MKKSLVITTMFLALTVMVTESTFAGRDGLIAPDVKYVDDYTLKGSVNFADIDPIDDFGNINVLIEIPSGTTAKWELDTDTGNIVWEFKKGKPRTVDYKGGYPVNYGTVSKTLLSTELGGEGESLDVILFGAQQKRGAIVEAKLIGMLKMKEGDGTIDDKLLAVVKGTPEYDVNDVDELNAKFNNIVYDVVRWFTGYKGVKSGITSRGIGKPYEAMRLFYASLWDFNTEKINSNIAFLLE